MGLIARQAEAAGIPTLCMGSALDILKAVRPPRAVFLDFPLGHTAGPADRPELQRAIMIETLEAFASLTRPGRVKSLDFDWPLDPDWKISAAMASDQRTVRDESPQYQNEADRRRAETGDLSALDRGCEICARP
ncbi:MAG: hypothetical protein KKB20_29235 [Proteobacteria bacterium]|nr:hypothetical protein [Pseudomonadota bacterium]